MTGWKALCAAAAVGSLGGCLVDFYGGNPRIQVANEAPRWRIRTLGVGDTAHPLWQESFDPLVGPAATTRVLELPVAGRLRVFIGLRDSMDRDSLASIQVRLEDGDFRKLEISEDSSGRFRVHESSK